MKRALNENDEVVIKTTQRFARVHRVRSTGQGVLYGLRYKSDEVHPDELRKRTTNHDHCDAYVVRDQVEHRTTTPTTSGLSRTAQLI